MGRELTEQDLVRNGEVWGAAMAPGTVVWLQGDLGTGKTTLVQALARGLGVMDMATSPTYGLVHQYAGRRGPVFHLDCYRFRGPDEAADIDWEEINRADVVLIEWPERAEGWAPDPDVRIALSHAERPDRRLIEVEPSPW